MYFKVFGCKCFILNNKEKEKMEKDVVEKKNRTLQEFARSMLNEHDLPKYFF